MINYELAKELKDAGLEVPYARTENYYPDVNVPTLEELIEACGDGKSIVIMGPNTVDPIEGYLSAEEEDLWNAFYQGERRYDFLSGQGSTPEEAVARLYLDLNKKNVL